MEDLRQYINLLEAIYDPALISALEVWADGYSKDDAFNCDSDCRDQEDLIIALARKHPVAYHSVLYRGTGISDEQFLTLEQGQRVTVKSSPARKILSWTKDPYVADLFARDAWDGGSGSCAVVMAIPGSELNVLVDLEDALKTSDEREVLAMNQEITLDPSNVIKMYRYEDL